MDIQNRKRKAWLNFLLTFLLCGTIVLLLLGTAFARYEKNVSKEFQLEYQAKTEQIFIKSIDVPESLQIDENSSAMAFEISNGISEEEYCSYSQIATISLFATVGLENPENFKVILKDGELNFEAVCMEVTEGSKLYSAYGPGWVYRFYNKAGEELKWQLVGERLSSRQMMIVIEGSSELPTALHLIASAKPGE